MIVRVPKSGDHQPPLWAGHLDKASAQKLMHSPVREEIARRLLQGDSAVWLFLESGHPAADDAASQMLETELRQAEKSLELPVPDPSDPKMRLELPLRLAFSVLRLARNDPVETILLSLLRHAEPALETPTGPVAIPVYGRGRVLGVLAGAHFNPGMIRDACAFITGACSCQVKEQNPGFDLLMTADWEASLGNQKDLDMPPLIGLSQGIAPSLVSPASSANSISQPSPDPAARLLKRNLLLVLALGLAALVLGTLRLKTGNHQR